MSRENQHIDVFHCPSDYYDWKFSLGTFRIDPSCGYNRCNK
jgi:hypothetical protein